MTRSRGNVGKKLTSQRQSSSVCLNPLLSAGELSANTISTTSSILLQQTPGSRCYHSIVIKLLSSTIAKIKLLTKLLAL